MQLVAEDLLCPSCSSYVHPFLERCPACGTDHPSLYDDAVAAGKLGAGALLERSETSNAAQMTVRRYALRAMSADPIDDLATAFGVVSASVRYRASVAAGGKATGDMPTDDPTDAMPTDALPAGPTAVDDASVVLVEGTLWVRGGPARKAIASIPLAGVLAATPIVKGVPAPDAWAGAVRGGRRVVPRRLVPGGDLLVTFSSGGTGSQLADVPQRTAGQLSLANRRGIFAQTARPDHYTTLARWIGILGAAAAEERWLVMGPAAYAAALGLGDPVAAGGAAAGGDAALGGGAAAGGEAALGGGAAASAASPGGGAMPSAPPTPVLGIRAALEELEALRAAGLVTPEEYDAKRREILARL